MPLFAPRSFRHALGSAMAVNVLARGIGYLRQVLIAYYFGVSRGLDIYYMTHGIAVLAVFSLGALLDQVAVPHLVRARESEGEASFRELSGSVFILSLAMGVILSASFILLLPWLAWALAHGFSSAERVELGRMGLHFLPWTLLSLPHSALGAILKSLRLYDVVLLGELLVTAAATAALWAWHPGPEALPLTLAAGYLASLLWLFWSTRRFTPLRGWPRSERMRPFYRNLAELFAAGQLGSLYSAVDRFFQSYLLPGSISALNYAVQTLSPFSDLVSFKELFVVPLSSPERRKEKLERFLSGILLVTVPLGVFLSAQAREIMALLYRRGSFGAEALHLSSSVFTLWPAVLLSGTAGAALLRMLLILDRIRFACLVYAFAAASLLLLGPLFLFVLRLDVQGLAVVLIANSYLGLALEFLFLARSGLRLDLRLLLRTAGIALLASLGAAWGAGLLPDLGSPLPTLALRASGFAALLGLAYWPWRQWIVDIIYGRAEATAA